MIFKIGFLLLFVVATQGGRVSESLLNKISSLAPGERFDVILQLPSIPMPPVIQREAKVSRKEKAEILTKALKEGTGKAQAPVLHQLDTKMGLRGNNVRSFWISNDIFISNIDARMVDNIKEMDGDFLIREPAVVNVTGVRSGPEIFLGDHIPNIPEQQWGVQKVQAPAVWETTKGEGVIVATIDTGVNIHHEALESNWAEGWFDPYYRDELPNDVHGHGTHVTGTIVGTKNGIGVAPEAKWIHCRGLNHYGWGFEEHLKTCGEWILTSDPIPHIVSNSWSGGSGDSFYNDVIKAWRWAEIIPVFSIGNSGPSCSTTGSPGDQPNVISVGATDINDAITFFSSRGPLKDRLKPEVSAPGHHVLSASTTSPSAYVEYSGTSMAAPHVAGVIALLLSKHPWVTFDVIFYTLSETCDWPRYKTQCRHEDYHGNEGENVSSRDEPLKSTYPNNDYGHGRVNVFKAFEYWQTHEQPRHL